MTAEEALRVVLGALIGREPTKLEWERVPSLAAFALLRSELTRLHDEVEKLREERDEAWDLLGEDAGSEWFNLKGRAQAAEAEVEKLGEALKERPEGREGIVTVYDSVTHRYLGCMGREVWEHLVENAATQDEPTASREERA